MSALSWHPVQSTIVVTLLPAIPGLQGTISESQTKMLVTVSSRVYHKWATKTAFLNFPQESACACFFFFLSSQLCAWMCSLACMCCAGMWEDPFCFHLTTVKWFNVGNPLALEFFHRECSNVVASWFTGISERASRFLSPLVALLFLNSLRLVVLGVLVRGKSLDECHFVIPLKVRWNVDDYYAHSFDVCDSASHVFHPTHSTSYVWMWL